MKILLLTKKFPFPLKDGESIAVHSLGQSLVTKGCAVSLLSMNTTKHFVDVDSIKDKVAHYQKIETVIVDNKIKKFEALKNLLSARSYHIERFHTQAYENKLASILEENSFDIILLESVYLTPYIPTIRAKSTSQVIMRAHNVEYEIWQRILANTSNFLKRKYLSIQVDRLRRFEISQLPKLDGLITFTQRDKDHFEKLGWKGTTAVSPIGIDVIKYTEENYSYSAQSIGFIGSLDWEPNIEGLFWFLKTVWPEVKSKVPNALLYIAGRKPRKAILDIDAPGVTVLGEVEDANAFVSKHPIAIVPLLSGGGMRVKILEAMALSRCIVSTTIGAEGIDTSSLCIADEEDDFSNKLITLLSDKGKREEKGKQARKIVSAKYDSHSNTKNLLEYMHSLIV